MKTRKFEIIECPKCGREYLPAEIFVPRAFFGKPEDIERDFAGKILSYEGTSVDLFEKYICDKCDTEFRIIAKLQLTTELGFPGNFNEEYLSKVENNLFDEWLIFLNEKQSSYLE